jgi:hypothetical protein
VGIFLLLILYGSGLGSQDFISNPSLHQTALSKRSFFHLININPLHFPFIFTNSLNPNFGNVVLKTLTSPFLKMPCRVIGGAMSKIKNG